MKIAIISFLLSAFLICLLTSNVNASTTNFRNDPSSRTFLIQPPDQRLNFLFAQQMEDSTESRTPSSLRLKSPYMAVFYSVIPGVIIHGFGHFYAGKEGTGSALLGIEAAGGLLLYLGFLSSFDGTSHQGDADMLGYTGLFLFIGSWVYDTVGSPIAVVRQNRYIREIEQNRYDFKKKQPGFRLTFTCHF